MVIIRKKDYGNENQRGHSDGKTLVSFVLDESGSMESMKAETISGFNEYIQTLKKKASNINITFAKFNSDQGVEVIYSNKSILDVAELNDDEYHPNGMTPLYDAIGQVIRDIEKNNAERILFVIQTDGLENASEEYDLLAIRALIKEKEKEGTWTFVYLGANQDAWGVGKGLGLHQGNVMDYNGIDTGDTFGHLAHVTCNYCSMDSSKTTNFWGGEKK